MLYLLALLIGVIAGLRAMTAPAAVSWGARLGWLKLHGTAVGFLGNSVMPWVFGVFALAELVTDQLPKTPSRKVPVQFATRLVTGALSGGAIGASGGALVPGIAAGAVGAILGTLGGAEMRSRLAKSFGKDRPAAIIEDILAVASAVVIVRLAAG
jgi:uncharacterized membrane protein